MRVLNRKLHQQCRLNCITYHEWNLWLSQSSTSKQTSIQSHGKFISLRLQKNEIKQKHSRAQRNRMLPFRERQKGTRAISKIVPTGSSYCRLGNSPIDRLASQKNGQENFSRKNKLLFSEFPYPNFRASLSNQPKDFSFFKPPIFSPNFLNPKA